MSNDPKEHEKTEIETKTNSEKGSKPLLALISRRKFMVAGAIGAVTVSISASKGTLITYGAEPPAFKWKTVLNFASYAASIMGYGPFVGLLTEFIGAVRAKDPQQAAKIVGESQLLRGKNYLDPLQMVGVPESWRPFIGPDGRVSLPFLHSNGLDGIASYILKNNILSRLAAPTHGAILASHESLIGNYGFSAEDLVGVFSPKTQLKEAFTMFGKSDKPNAGDRYQSELDTILRFFHRNTGTGTAQNDVVFEGLRDPTSGKKINIENTVGISYVA
jgi:hypothetical protein